MWATHQELSATERIATSPAGRLPSRLNTTVVAIDDENFECEIKDTHLVQMDSGANISLLLRIA